MDYLIRVSVVQNTESNSSSTMQDSSWEPNNSSASSDISRNLRNLAVSYRVHNSWPLVPILSPINTSQGLELYSFEFYFNVQYVLF